VVGETGRGALGVTVFRLFSQVATVTAASFDMEAETGGGADWGRALAGGGETDTLRAAAGPRPDRKRCATALPAVEAAADSGSDEDDWKRLGWGARGD
jgi:hypothetical protein